LPGVSPLIARFEKLGLSVDFPKTPGLFLLYRTRAEMSVTFDISECYAALFSTLPCPDKSALQYGQIFLSIITVFMQ
jgi:hypothetical protein